ncbi:MAG: RagB/SusD family nutrient uptake outer membrane protein [Pseudobacter sp.]|uniref:RagB/SusD family nutrient uptake outer membrane protein n=1 Tax=Pseudobacter sp. TaxID=2045420 RepID=UPI003F8138EB
MKYEGNNNWRSVWVWAVLAITLLGSCKKYLDQKPDETLSTLEKIADMQSFLDDNRVMNQFCPKIPGIASDDYYITTTDFNGLSFDLERKVYLWEKADLGVEVTEWPYKPILYCNTVLDEIENIKFTSEEQSQFNNVKGSAHFFRAFYFASIAEIFSQPFNKSSSAKDLGIPLRLSSDFSGTTSRSSVKETFEQIIQDLHVASNLLPLKSRVFTRPSKASSYALLARTYLVMGEYDSSLFYADKTLLLHDSLISYNSLDANSDNPLPIFNKEVIFYAKSPQTEILSSTYAKVDSTLILLYDEKDLRKKVLFQTNWDGTMAFKGDYSGGGLFGGGNLFTGIAADEIFLIKAECHARKGQLAESLAALNSLLETRWLPNQFIPVATTDEEELLTIVLNERRKELLFRGTRWSDLRRLRGDPQRAISPKRLINDQEIVLHPNSTKYAFQIPYYVIAKTGITQNP